MVCTDLAQMRLTQMDKNITEILVVQKGTAFCGIQNKMWVFLRIRWRKGDRITQPLAKGTGGTLIACQRFRININFPANAAIICAVRTNTAELAVIGRATKITNGISS